MKKIISVALAGLLLSSSMCFAGYDEGLAAAQKGDFKTAISNWVPLAKQGNVNAQHNLGYMYEKGLHNNKEAMIWYRKAAEQGHPGSQNNIGGLLYKIGKGAPKDFKEAADWTLKSAEQGNENAQNRLGQMYEHGHGVPKDINEALAWYRKSAAQGNDNAQDSVKWLTRSTVKSNKPKQTEAERSEEIRANACATSNYDCKKDIWGGKY